MHEQSKVNKRLMKEIIMFTRKNVYKCMVILAIASLHGVMQGEVSYKQQLADQVIFHTPTLALTYAGLRGLKSVMEHGISRENIYAPLIATAGLVAAPAWAGYVQRDLRTYQAPSSRWWFAAPIASTVTLAALMGYKYGNCFNAAAAAILASIPAMYYAKQYADQEAAVEYRKKMADLQVGMRFAMGTTWGRYNRFPRLNKALKILANESSNSALVRQYTADPEITVGQMNNLIEISPWITEPDLKGLLQRILFQTDADQIDFKKDTQNALRTLQDVLESNKNILRADPKKIKEHDFIKLRKSLNFLGDHGNYSQVGEILHDQTEAAALNALLQEREDQYSVVGLPDLANEYEKMREFIKAAREGGQVFENSQARRALRNQQEAESEKQVIPNRPAVITKAVNNIFNQSYARIKDNIKLCAEISAKDNRSDEEEQSLRLYCPAIEVEARKSADAMKDRLQKKLKDSVGNDELAAALVHIKNAKSDAPGFDIYRQQFFDAVNKQIFADEEYYAESFLTPVAAEGSVQLEPKGAKEAEKEKAEPSSAQVNPEEGLSQLVRTEIDEANAIINPIVDVYFANPNAPLANVISKEKVADVQRAVRTVRKSIIQEDLYQELLKEKEALDKKLNEDLGSKGVQSGLAKMADDYLIIQKRLTDLKNSWIESQKRLEGEDVATFRSRLQQLYENLNNILMVLRVLWPHEKPVLESSFSEFGLIQSLRDSLREKFKDELR